MSKAEKRAMNRDAVLDAESLARIFHDIRTPLTPLKLKIQLARRFLKQLTAPPEQLERFDELLSGAERELDRVTAAVESFSQKTRDRLAG